MSRRSTTARYQTVARAWLTLAACSLLVPARWRLGLWLPIHLALAGAVATAISGAMQSFIAALTSAPDPPRPLVTVQLASLTAGVAAITVGMPAHARSLTAVGGVAFVAAMAILAWVLRVSWRRSIQVRRPLPLAAYAIALASVLVGASVGALLGSGSLAAGGAYARAMLTHRTLNVLGFASLTVVGTLVTLLPTVLRVRIPRHRGPVVVVSVLTGGLVLQVAGYLLDARWVLAAGGIAYAAGTIAFAGFVVAVVRSERRWAIPAAGFHLLAAFAWFVVGSVGLAVALFDGPAGAARNRAVFLTAFVGGWLIQVLLGAWSYLLPMARPGHPTERRRWLWAFERAAPLQIGLLNVGLLVLAGVGAGWLPSAAAPPAATVALAGGIIALAKAWSFPAAAWAAETERAKAVWGADPAGSS